jgi:opacity protein-like surface antigen
MRTTHLAVLAVAVLAPAAADAARVKVITDPVGATVSQGTLLLGTTTDRGLILDFTPGKVTLTVEKPGFRTMERTVVVVAGPPMEVTIRLRPLGAPMPQGAATGQPSAVPPPTGEGPRRSRSRPSPPPAPAPAPSTAPVSPPPEAPPPPRVQAPPPPVEPPQDVQAPPEEIAPPPVAPAASAGTRRFSVLLSGGIATGRSDFTATRGFTEFAEDGRLDADYAGDTGAAFELGVQYLFTTHFGVAVAGMVATPKDTAHFNGVFPHPLFFDQDRLAEGDVAGLDRKETAVFFDLVAAGSAGRLGWRLFGGPAWLKVDADVIESIEYSQEYPFNELTVTGETRTEASDSGVGFSVGGGLDYEIASSVALGLQLRYSRATGELELAGQDPLEVDIGGLQAGLVLHLRF